MGYPKGERACCCRREPFENLSPMISIDNAEVSDGRPASKTRSSDSCLFRQNLRAEGEEPPFSFNRSIYLTVVSEVAFDPLVQSGVRRIPGRQRM